MASQKRLLKLKVYFENDQTEVDFDMNDYNVKEFDHWLRSRFGVENEVALKYMDHLGAGKTTFMTIICYSLSPNLLDVLAFLIEIAPTKSYVEANPRLYIKVTHLAHDKVLGLEQYTFAAIFLGLTTLMLIAGLYAETLNPLLPIKIYCNQLDSWLIDLGLIQKKGAALESFIATVCWSSTYIYIRRFWNPENYGFAIEKYGADSFFGGLCAGGAVLLKHILQKALA